MKWFETEGVKLLTQEDECVFLSEQNAMESVHPRLSAGIMPDCISPAKCSMSTP